MDNSGAGAYIYAKASGILGKSFIGPKANTLFEQKNLSELWHVIFNTQAPLVPEVMLAQKIEEEAFKRFIKQYTYFISQYSKPHKILIAQLGIYEAENLKEIGAALCAGEEKCPKIVDIGKFATINAKAWPDIALITENSRYNWYNYVPDIHEQQSLEFKIDMQEMKDLWTAIKSTSGEEKLALLDLYKNEYIIKNVVWALRLKIHYQMENEEILEKLIYVTDDHSENDPIAAEAIQILNYPTDEYEVWKKWKYKELINPIMDNSIWKIDPTWIENRNKIKVNKLALRIFHRYPMSVCSLIGWYKIKKFELSCIRTAVESLRLDIPSEQAKQAVGITAEFVS